MKIESSAVTMNASRNYEAVELTQIQSEETKWVQTNPRTKQDAVDSSDNLDGFLVNTKKFLSDNSLRLKDESPALAIKGSQSSSAKLANPEDAQISLIKLMLEKLLRNRHRPGTLCSTLTEFSQKSNQSLSLSFTDIQSFSAAAAPGIWVRNVTAVRFFSESESTSFSSVGIAKTSDGRELNFGINVEMSRSFMEYTKLQWSEQVVMTDPLVINLSSNPVGLSDQKFCFDIDSDGKEDSISYLNQGSGYLALDRNSDGKINDGNELFGAKTGNGFAELSAYDTDKNGWIDENDEIYSKLKVWLKVEDGTDRLMDLKTADIGAIFLGSCQTDFTLKSAASGQTNGQIRRTGFYLKESSGMAESVQQIDVSV
ncbi:hypothetical protein [Aminipila sp.]|uniref:hypothetical protein n=1 Tax=Aminipila sp. TaxID=2060095 RepID=UPI00289D6264|nr:hypothetical protein [Aminipila sp.]